MPKSAIDATRFTSTTPHASARPPASSTTTSAPSSIPNRTPGPPGETPQQKVRRLREAAAKARNAKISTFDKVIIRGRVWADRAHRFTALTLIGLTGIAGVVTVYALGDMMIYNRRKRREYFAEQLALHNATVYEAQKAIRRGTATEEQLVLLQKEEEKRQAEEAKAAAKVGILTKVKNTFYPDLKVQQSENTEVLVGSKIGFEGVVKHDDSLGEGESAILKAVEERKQELKEQDSRPASEAMVRSGGRTGGPLDQLGTNVAAADSATADAPKQGGGWTSFLTRR